MIYNVTYKGISLGMTFNRKEAYAWCNTKDHKITARIHRPVVLY